MSEKITRINDNMRIKHVNRNYEVQRKSLVEIVEIDKETKTRVNTGKFREEFTFVGFAGTDEKILNSIILKDMLHNESPEEYSKWANYIKNELTPSCEEFKNIPRIEK